MIYQYFCQTLLHVFLSTKQWKYNVSIVMWAGRKRASAWWVHHLGCLGVAPSSISVAWMHLCHRQSLRRKMLLTCFSASMEPAMKTRYVVTVWCIWLTVSLFMMLKTFTDRDQRWLSYPVTTVNSSPQSSKLYLAALLLQTNVLCNTTLTADQLS